MVQRGGRDNPAPGLEGRCAHLVGGQVEGRVTADGIQINNAIGWFDANGLGVSLSLDDTERKNQTVCNDTRSLEAMLSRQAQ